MHEYLQLLFTLLAEMSPYLLLGFFIAGLLQSFVPKGFYRQYLAKNSFKSVLAATIFGIPLPLCSCGVIPTAVSLRRQGASNGATTAFLATTPQTGVDSIMATYSLLGIPFAILRPVAALFIGLLSGVSTNLFGDKEAGAPIDAENDDPNTRTDASAKSSLKDKMVQVFTYGFVDMIQDVGRWLIIGLLAAAAISTLVPDSFFGVLAEKPILNLFLVILLSVPMYLCATGSIPIAMSMMLKGLSPGAAFVLLMAGPATNIASIVVVSKVLGKKNAAIYLASIISGAIVIGLMVDTLFPSEWFTMPTALTQASCHEELPLFNIISSVVFIGLLINAFYRKHKNSKQLNTEKSMLQSFRIDGMSCNHCKTNVEKNLATLPGVTDVKVDLEKGIAYVEGTVNADEVEQKVTQLGYEFIK